ADLLSLHNSKSCMTGEWLMRPKLAHNSNLLRPRSRFGAIDLSHVSSPTTLRAATYPPKGDTRMSATSRWNMSSRIPSFVLGTATLALLAAARPSAGADKPEKKTQGMSHPRAKAGAGKGGAIQKAAFGQVDGKPVDLYTLTNSKGMVAKVTNYGAI